MIPYPLVRRHRLLVLADHHELADVVAHAIGGTADLVFEPRLDVARGRLRDGEWFDLVVCAVTVAGMSGADVLELVVREFPAARDAFVFVLPRGGVDPSLASSLAATGRPCLKSPVGGDELRVLARAQSVVQVRDQDSAPSPLATSSPALESIFANAERTAKTVSWAGQKHRESMVLDCPHCGAPQEAALDFMCRYCKKPMGQTRPA